MPLTLILMVVALAAAVYMWTARRRLRLELRELWRTMRAHRLVTGLLAVLSVICGILVAVMIVSPLHLALFLDGQLDRSTAPAAILLVLPIVAGACAGWWEAWRAAERTHGRRTLDHGLLAGLLAMALPALLGAVGLGGVVWADEQLPAGPPLIGELLWAAAILALGLVFGVIGAFVGAGLAGRPRLFHRGPRTPTVPR